MKKTYLWSLLTIAALLVAQNTVSANEEHMRHKMKNGGDKGKMFEKMSEELGLSVEQKAALEAKKKARFEKSGQTREAMQKKKEELRIELDKPQTDMNRVNALIDEETALHRQALVDRTQGILEMKKILTPEQFAKLQSKMKEKREKWGKNKEQGRQGHEGHGSEGSEENS